jgi:alpha-beta hydrolase superfamily lysophospholipase
MKSVLYFHGFASSPASAKITALRPLLEPRGIELNTPDLNVPSFGKLDWESLVSHAAAEARKNPPAAMVGSSLGALVALAVARHGVHVPMVLIAPALGVAARWKQKLPAGDPVMVFNHALAADAPIHRAFFEQMANLHVDDEPPQAPVTVIMGRLDETVPFQLVRETWDRWNLPSPSRFIEIPNGDHGLVEHSQLIADAIVEAAG